VSKYTINDCKIIEASVLTVHPACNFCLENTNPTMQHIYTASVINPTTPTTEHAARSTTHAGLSGLY